MAKRTLINDRYELDDMPIAKGGMGQVWGGRDTKLDREVVVKLVRFPDGVPDQDYIRRFVRESRITARLQHPGVPAVFDVGTHEGRLELSYVELPTIKRHTAIIPLHINVVPGDQAAGRIPDPVVRTELLFQRVQQAKRRASRHLSQGNTSSALAEMEAAEELVQQGLSGGAPEPLAADLAEEADTLRYLTGRSQRGETSAAAKHASMDSTYKSAKRGRPRPRATPDS